ncbi:MAG: hypothetical protein JOZ48_06390 [Acidobacteriaceae bacterium]|nr:hypothetical protein [Acidobacteriaceae bacterium]
MPRVKPRNRIVVFRVTEEEYNSLLTACALSGGRSLSDYARSELLSTITSEAPAGISRCRCFDMDQKVSEIHRLLKNVFEIVSADGALGRNGDGANR